MSSADTLEVVFHRPSSLFVNTMRGVVTQETSKPTSYARAVTVKKKTRRAGVTYITLRSYYAPIPFEIHIPVVPILGRLDFEVLTTERLLERRNCDNLLVGVLNGWKLIEVNESFVFQPIPQCVSLVSGCW